MESEPMLTPREKSPQPEKISPEEDRTHDTASSRTASPTLYQRAVPAFTDCLIWELFTLEGTLIASRQIPGQETCFKAIT